MKTKDSKFFLIILSLGVGLLVSWSLFFKTYHQADKVNIHLFPKQIQDWSAEELPITKDEYAILETQNAFIRRYFTSSGKEVFLFIVYSENNRKVSHPPEVCYIGNGVSILSHVIESIPATSLKQSELVIKQSELVIKSNKLLVEQGQNQQVIYYWFKVGDSFTPNYWKQQMLIVFKTLFGQPSSSALIRISATIKDDDKLQAERDAKEFSNIILPSLFEYLP